MRALICLLFIAAFCAPTSAAELAGTIETGTSVSAVAVAPGSDIAFGISAQGKTLYIFDLENLSIIRSIRLNRKPNALAVDSASGRAYMTSSGSGGRGLLIEADEHGRLSSVFLPKDPQGIAIDASYAAIAAEKDKQVLIVSLSGFTVTKTISLPHRPKNICLDMDSGRAVILAAQAEGEGKQNRVLIVDIKRGAVIKEIVLSREAVSISLDTDKDIAIAVSDKQIAIIDINTAQVVSYVPVAGAGASDVNQSTHVAAVAVKDGLELFNLESLSSETHPFDFRAEAIAIDPYRNIALMGTKDGVAMVRLPNPVPEISALIPQSARPGQGVNLTVKGDGFVMDSAVSFGGLDVTASFKNNEELGAVVPGGLITAPGTVPVIVVNPPPGGGASEPYPFVVKYPIPVLSSISPATVNARTGFTVKAYGSNFLDGYVINLGGSDLETEFIGDTELWAEVPASLVSSKGEYPVTVISPDRQNSNFKKLVVTDPAPAVADFSPKSGGTGTVVALRGENFTGSFTYVYFGGARATILALSQTEMRAVVPGSAVTGPVRVITSVGSAESGVPFVVEGETFGLSVAPRTISIPQGGSASALVMVTSERPFTGRVSLSIEGVPLGVEYSFSPDHISAGVSFLTINLTGALNVSTVLTITGTSPDAVSSSELIIEPVAPGTTTLSGRVLAARDDRPVKGVTLMLGGRATLTDEAGNFMFLDPPVGEQVVMLEGETANTVFASYPSAIPVPVLVEGGKDNTLPYPVYLHEVNTRHFTWIEPSVDTIVTDPDIPDFEMKIPAGVQIIGWDGLPNERVSVTVVPADRIPIRPPAGVSAQEIFMFYFFKRGGGTPSSPVPVKFPNTFGAMPGERLDLWYYDESPQPDPASNQWKVFGQGTVSPDGRQVIPDSGAGIPKFCCGAARAQRRVPPPRIQPSPPDACKIGDPVDPLTGRFTYDETDISFPSPSMVSLRRIYSSDSGFIGQFGRGVTTNYDYNVAVIVNALILNTPEGGTYILSKGEDDTYSNRAYPFLSGAIARVNADGTSKIEFRGGALYEFDVRGRLKGISDPNGNSLVIVRDLNAAITEVSDSFGSSLYFINSEALIITNMSAVLTALVYDHFGREAKYSYDALANPLSVEIPGEGATSYEYGPFGITKVIKPHGAEVTNEYSPYSGRVIKQAHANGGVFKYRYILAGGRCIGRDGDPNCSGSSNGNTRTSCFKNEFFQCSPYEPENDYQKMTTGGVVTGVEMTDPLGNRTVYRLNSAGYMTMIEDAYGQKTHYERRFRTNELLSVTDPLGRKVSFTYDEIGNMISATDHAGNITAFEYDNALGRPIRVTDAMGNITEITYDSKGNPSSIKSPGGGFASFLRDARGFPVSITDALGRISRMEYDGRGYVTRVTDPSGNFAVIDYDDFGRPSKVVDPAGNETYYSYDAAGRVMEIEDALGGLTGFSYDESGNLTRLTDPKGQTVSYTYDERNNVSSMTDQLGRVETYEHDTGDNLTKVIDRAGRATVFEYDRLGMASKVSYADGTFTAYEYDSAGRMTSVSDSQAGAVELGYSDSGCSGGCAGGSADKVLSETTAFGKVSYTYDALGRRTSMTVAGQEAVHYSYDAGGRLASLAQGDKAASFAYDVLGRRTSMVLPNGIEASYAYDNADNLVNITYSAGSQVIKSLSYSYDSSGNRVSLSGHTSLMPEPAAATYDLANRMIAFNGESLSYDLNGNLIRKGDAAYEWDARGRLVGISGPNINASFKYDALGRRAEKTVNGKTTDYLYDGMDIVQEIEDGRVSAEYLRSLHIDETLGIFGQDGAYYYIHDALGSTIALTDPSCNIIAEYHYDPFGKTTATNPLVHNPFQFAGRENDGGGHYYLRNRYTLDGRFISEDPIGMAGGLNLYSYVDNSPTNFVDPLGLIAIPVDTLWDLGNVSYDLAAGDYEALQWDLAALVVPYVPAGLTKGAKACRATRTVARVYERHHLLPVQFKSQFKRAGLDIENYVISLPKGDHRLTPGGLHTGANSWNKQWDVFFREHHDRVTKEQILKQLGKMRKAYGI